MLPTTTTTIDHECQQCSTDVTVPAQTIDYEPVAYVSGVRAIRARIAWDCPACGSGYEQTIPFDTDLFTESGFHSWLGEVAGGRACIVTDRPDGSEFGSDHTERSGRISER